MDFRLTPEDLELRDRARSFTEQVLIPLELECEEHDGLGAESSANAKQAVLDAGFNAINHARDDGGRGLDLLQQILIEEQWGPGHGRALGHPVAAVDPPRERHPRPEGAVPPPGVPGRAA